MRGISLFAGGFPFETDFRIELEKNAVSWPKEYYFYLGAIFLIMSFSAYIKIKKQKTQEARLVEANFYEIKIGKFAVKFNVALDY